LRGLAMRFLVLLALILCFVALLAFGFLVLVRELLARDIFGAPSLRAGRRSKSKNRSEKRITFSGAAILIRSPG